MMKSTGPVVLIATVALMLIPAVSGCIDPIDLDVGDPQRSLVVEGVVREGPGPHRVILSQSGAFAAGIEALRPRITGATVVVEVGDGTEVVLEELASPVLYESPAGALFGEVGQSYALRIELRDGTVYRSPAVTMRAAPDILALRSSLEEGSRLVNGVLISDPSIDLLVDAASFPDQPNYYRWTWQGTYSRQACYSTGGPFPTEFCDRCYLQVEGRSLVEVADDGLAAGNVLANQLAASFALAQDGFRFIPAFHITVLQESLTPEAFQFWSLIRDSRDNVGSLFDPPAEATFSNLENVDDPTDRPLGYFTVAGATAVDTCIRRDDFDPSVFFPALRPLRGQCGVTVPGSRTPPAGFIEACAAD
jgi:hypothetical protein